MNYKFIHGFFAILVVAFFLLSNSGGAGLVQDLDRTGSPISTSFCAACHSGPDFEPEMRIQLKQGNRIVNKYIPGESYRLEIALNARFGNPFGYGMQAVILNDSNGAMGSYGTPASGTQLTTINGIPYFEQDRVSTSNVFSIDWTAPNSGTGTANIYVGAVAVNGSGDTNGDGAVKGELTITEMISSGLETTEATLSASLVQNPVEDHIRIKFPNGLNGPIQADLFDLKGQKIGLKEFNASSVSNLEWNVSSLPTGIYLLSLKCQNNYRVLKILKE